MGLRKAERLSLATWERLRLLNSELQRISIREVARRAKVSIATVSRAINGKPKVSSTVSKRVWRVVREIGYYPNTHARTLVQGRSRILGLMVSPSIGRIFPEILNRFAELGVEHNHAILLSPIPEHSDRLELAARGLIERRVDGVAILTFRREKSLVKIFERNHVQVITIDSEFSKPSPSTVQIDYEHGIRQAVQHLAAIGHVDIAFIGGPLHSKASMAQKHAFRNCMREIALPSKLLFEGGDTLEAGFKAMCTMARLPHRPSAVICSHDMTAIGVMQEALDLHINIPRDLSVVGFHDIDAAQFTTPALTTVRISQTEIANAAFRALLNAIAIESSASLHEQCTIKTNLVLRSSTAIAPCRLSASVAASVPAPCVIDSAATKEVLNVYEL